MQTMRRDLSKGEANRLKIVQAADDLFYRQGYNVTSFTDIAEAAAVPRGNFYYYFKTKDEILAGVVDQRLEWLRALLAQWQETIAAPRDRLLAFADLLVANEENVLQYGCPLGSLNAELSKTRDDLRSKTVELLDTVVRWMVPQIEALGHDEQAAHELALQLLARTQGAILIAQVYRHRDFLHAEVARIKQWILEL